MDWTMVAALGTWTTILSACFYLIVKLTIKAAIADTLKELSVVYMPREVAEEKFKAIHSRLKSLEDK